MEKSLILILMFYSDKKFYHDFNYIKNILLFLLINFLFLLLFIILIYLGAYLHNSLYYHDVSELFVSILSFWIFYLIFTFKKFKL
jgi:hypothetical protein